MNLRKNVGVFILVIMSLFLTTLNVFAEEAREDLIKKIAPDGKNATFKMKKPANEMEGDMLVSGYVNSIMQSDDYYVIAGCYEAPYTDCTIDIYSKDYESDWDSELQKEVALKGWRETYNIHVTYDEPEENKTVNEYIGKLKEMTPSNPETFYNIEDLSLINYYLTSNKSELWNPGAPGRALKYSTINDITKGSNVSYYLEIRAGSQDENLMYESSFGPMTVFYNGYAYGVKNEGLYLKRVIYIPEDTEETTEAYILAAQKRIDDYLGNSEVQVSLGGALSSLPEDSEDESYVITGHDGNYYNIKIGDRTYKFYLVKASSEKLVEPEYLGTDIESNIEITSSDATIPLDTTLTVKNVNDSSIKDKIGTKSYKSYDISLYSSSKETKIEKLENGKFNVRIPVPKELDGKALIVYYIKENGEKEEHAVTVKNGYAEFETNHFSVYTLAQRFNNPQTNDNIANYMIIALFSAIIVISGCVVTKKSFN